MSRRVLSILLPQLAEPRLITVLDTPAGFQPNHRQVAERLVQFLTEKLAEWRPRPSLVETRASQVDATALVTLAHSHCIMAGPGSPTYMVRELMGTPYWEAIRQAHANGTIIYASSAASIALSALSLPVYEIFKVGDVPYWNKGLNFFEPFGFSLAIVPHWNNQEGGATVDTRYCYMGQDRFEILRKQLPSDIIILGLDEHTACILDFDTGRATIEGKGRVHLIRDERFMEWAAGETFPLSFLSASEIPLQSSSDFQASHPIEAIPVPAITLDPRIEEDALAAQLPPTLIDEILSIRAALRQAKQWQLADRLRNALVACDVIVEDTPTGSSWHLDEH